MNNVSWIITVLVPYALLVGMTMLVRGRGTNDHFYKKAVDLSLDGCILGLGITAAIFGSRETRIALQENALYIGLLVSLINIFMLGFCANVSDLTQGSELRKAILSVLAASGTVAANTYVVEVANGAGYRLLALSCIGSILVPLGLLWLIELVRDKPQLPSPVGP